MNKITPTLKALALASVVLALLGCNKISREAESSSMIVIQGITGTTTEGDAVAFLQSDVQRIGATGPSVFADVATASIIVRLINPTPIDGPSQFNDVLLDSIKVTIELPAGGGTPGVDVPPPFEANFSTVLCQVDKATTVPFVVVLESAKLAAPLVNLVGTATVLERKAKIEIFGHDLTDHPVTAVGYLTVYFGDYMDPVIEGAAIKK